MGEVEQGIVEQLIEKIEALQAHTKYIEQRFIADTAATMKEIDKIEKVVSDLERLRDIRLPHRKGDK